MSPRPVESEIVETVLHQSDQSIMTDSPTPERFIHDQSDISLPVDEVDVAKLRPTDQLSLGSLDGKDLLLGIVQDGLIPSFQFGKTPGLGRATY